MLIRDAEVEGGRRDLRIAKGLITAVGAELAPRAGEAVLDAQGGALLPGLHDHHIHLNATAAASSSVRCGPPQVTEADELIEALCRAPGEGWLRGVGYHDGVAGEISREWLDRHGPPRPVRIQHRSGRLWILNGRATALLGDDAPRDGRLLDGDAWLRTRLRADPPDLRPLGDMLARRGVTGLTETTPRNRIGDFHRYAAAGLPQRLVIMGDASLDRAPVRPRARAGAVKLHYHDHDLPALDDLTTTVRRAHAAGRPVAVHCVTRTELLLALAAIESAGAHRGDRIEHAAIAPPEAVDWIARLGLSVVTQPHFIAERGNAYIAEVEAGERPWLYRLAAFREAGIPLAAGSDAPFGGLDPWASMAAAVERHAALAPEEALSPEAALALYTGAAEDPGGAPRRIAEGEPADLCLLDRGWATARADLARVKVRLTLVAGEVAYGEAPRSCGARAAPVGGHQAVGE